MTSKKAKRQDEKKYFLAFWWWIKIANISFLSRCSFISKIQKSDFNKNALSTKIYFSSFLSCGRQIFFQVTEFLWKIISKTQKSMVIQIHYVELCFTCHPQYGLLSDHVASIRIEGAILHGRKESKNMACSNMGNLSNGTRPDSVQVFLYIYNCNGN